MIAALGLRRIGIVAAAVAGLALVIGVTIWVGKRFSRPDPLPATIARADEKAAREAAETIARELEARNHDATVTVDVTTKEIRDAFDATPPPAADAQPRAFPAAPVDRLRDRLNKSIARANRAAGTAVAPD